MLQTIPHILLERMHLQRFITNILVQKLIGKKELGKEVGE